MGLCSSLPLCAALLGLFVAVVPAVAANDILSDNDLVARANAVFAAKEAPVDRILGIHKGLPVIVDVRCSDICPNYTVRIIHYAGAAEAACAQTRADLVMVNVPRSITTGPEKFCVPHALVSRRQYTDRPYQR